MDTHQSEVMQTHYTDQEELFTEEPARQNELMKNNRDTFSFYFSI
jgi:hypothetical protein